MPLPSDPLAALRQARRDPDLVLIEGFHALKHALRFGADILRAAITDPEEVRRLAGSLAPDLLERLPADTPVVTSERIQAAGLKAPITGVLAVAPRPAVDVGAALADPRPAPVVLLERPRGLGNIGWCVRTAAAADIAGLFTTGIHDPWCPTAVRIGVGLQFALPVARVAGGTGGADVTGRARVAGGADVKGGAWGADLTGGADVAGSARVAGGADLTGNAGARGGGAIGYLPDSDRPLIAVDTGGEAVHPRELPARAILAFGTERHGLSEELLAHAQASVSLPMRPGVSSLNLATSVAALLYAWRLSADGRGKS